jgi:hypothetical protein
MQLLFSALLRELSVSALTFSSSLQSLIRVQQSPQRVRSQLRGMKRRLRQASHRLRNLLRRNLTNLPNSTPTHQLRQRRPASNCSGAPAAEKPHFPHHPTLHNRSKPKHISAHRIANLNLGRSPVQCPRIPRMLKMIQKLRGKHPSTSHESPVTSWPANTSSPSTQ